MDIITIFAAFFEGFALIISPCILPILPIVLAGSLTGNKSRPIGIIIGFIIIFSLITLFTRALIEFLHIEPNILRDASYGILIFLGVVITSTYLTEKFNLFASKITNFGHFLISTSNQERGFWGGLLFGGLIGIIWVPCAGPILATVAVQVVMQQKTLYSFFAVFAFAFGVSVPMLIIALTGRQMMENFSFFRKHPILFRKIFGLMIIASALFSIYFPKFTLLYSQTKITPTKAQSLINGLAKPYPAPAISGIDTWINSAPLTMRDLKNKVVLVDFWTYSCINCIRTLPFLKEWYAKYHNMGFIVIGIHAPEFQFEQNLENVEKAAKEDEIFYPVGLDNKFVTWTNFHNHYWPAHYLINKEGLVVYQHVGEGEYSVTENNIRYLLGLSGQVSTKFEKSHPFTQTPEIYLGYERTENLSSPEPAVRNNESIYSFPKMLGRDNWALKGKWIIRDEKIIAASPGASIKVHFYAGKVYAVMGVVGKSTRVEVLLNGSLLLNNSGQDVLNGQVQVDRHQLYSLVNFAKASNGELELIVTQPGLELYTFTFGN